MILGRDLEDEEEMYDDMYNGGYEGENTDGGGEYYADNEEWDEEEYNDGYDGGTAEGYDGGTADGYDGDNGGDTTTEYNDGAVAVQSEDADVATVDSSEDHGDVTTVVYDSTSHAEAPVTDGGGDAGSVASTTEAPIIEADSSPADDLVTSIPIGSTEAPIDESPVAIGSTEAPIDESPVAYDSTEAATDESSVANDSSTFDIHSKENMDCIIQNLCKSSFYWLYLMAT